MSSAALAPFSPPPTGRMTVEEWAALPEDTSGELEDGQLVEEEMPSGLHEATVVWLITTLSPWGRRHGARVFGSGLKFGLSETTGRMPDLSVFLADVPRPPARGVVRTAPSIAVEVVSPSPGDARRDRVETLAEYARFGVHWYWLVDPELRSFEVFELDVEGRYVHVLGLAAGTAASIPGCDGLRLDLDDLWRELDAVIAEGGD